MATMTCFCNDLFLYQQKQKWAVEFPQFYEKDHWVQLRWKRVAIVTLLNSGSEQRF